jgi:hypothetical protein
LKPANLAALDLIKCVASEEQLLKFYLAFEAAPKIRAKAPIKRQSKHKRKIKIGPKATAKD